MSAVVPNAKKAALKALLLSATVRVVLIDEADYAYDYTHEFLSSIPLVARIATSGALTNKTFNVLPSGSGGAGYCYFKADNAVFTNVSGDSAEAAMVFVDTGSEATSNLVAYINGLNITPSGVNINLVWSSDGIFRI